MFLIINIASSNDTFSSTDKVTDITSSTTAANQGDQSTSSITATSKEVELTTLITATNEEDVVTEEENVMVKRNLALNKLISYKSPRTDFFFFLNSDFKNFTALYKQEIENVTKGTAFPSWNWFK
jgi:hypothetical protein